ncbi:hypothetical protein [Megamonas hypermegale]|jgi:predicted membrane channel-forming protein YqfA (hemolysin III family)|uniref:hypothetical protein n=1 Tax=Megamonas hypermegale TaxID=158847 RepID=UPI003209F085
MNTIEIIKYISLGIVSIIGFCILLAIIGGIFRLLLDVIVFIIVAPFYILFHPMMFITKPKTCFKNILIKTPCIGEDIEYKELANANKNKIWVRDTIAEDFQKLCEKWYWDDYFSKKRK